MVEKNSKDLLKLEVNAKNVCLESKLFVCKKNNSFAPLQKPSTSSPVPKSRVLGKVHDFLGIISESNKRLLHEAKDNPEKYDIEVLNGKESEFIEMDLMLGVADLHTPEAVVAAESAMAGHPPLIHLAESEDSSEDDDDDDDDDDDEDKEEKISKPEKHSKIVELS
ncbi:hypothetical protein CASFOL_009702 [Castilleja foliolosa]|uniref:Uncharacterized protein n=1 Tax=Castilleja foliolosa TaxID=1961234 RepID=A0ABD3DSS5_9LAMI